MDGGQVRAILWRHATARAAHPPGTTATAPSTRRQDPAVPQGLPDPNALVPAGQLRSALDAATPARQRELAADYVALWARTFRTLVAQLRGRPERALALFADEVYPFLRGDRLAARVADVRHHRATLLLAGGLPDAYVAGLAEAFVALSGATATAAATGPGRIEVDFRVAHADRLARIAQHAAALRLNLVVAALLAATLGIALALANAPVSATRALVVLVGIAAAQVAANALHTLRHGHPAGPLAPLRPGRRTLLAQLLGAGLVASLAAGWLAATGTPLVLLFAAAGIGVGLLYAPLRDRGLGPVVITVLYGPLIAEGALHAFAVGAHHADHVALLPWTLVPGALAAAALYLDDLADAPLDEAGGKRTLAVRLPRPAQGLVYSGLLSLAFLPLLVLGIGRTATLAAGVLALVGLLLVWRVRSGLGDPHRLAVARLGTQLLHATTVLGVAALLGGAA